MPRNEEQVLSRRERQIMDVIYAANKATAAEVVEALPGNLSNSTVRTLLRILVEKGHLKQKFDGPVVVDMLCYLRLYTELALRAKGVLLMRENGLDVPVGERTRAKFDEMRYLEKSIGKTGCLAMSPFLQMTRKDLWQLYVLEK